MAKKKQASTPKNPVAEKKKGNLVRTGRQYRWIALAIAVFAALLYINTLGHDYVLDDFSQIKENFVTKQGWDGIPTQWKTNARYGYRPGPGELYRPVPMTMFSLEWELAPDSPAVGHFVNILLYALTGSLLFLTLRRILKDYNPLLPLLTTLFFIAHPVHTEVVANIKSRDEIVMFLMAILALNCLWKYIGQQKIGWLAAALLSYLVALFSKENAVTFIAIFPLFLFFFSRLSLSRIAALTGAFVIPAVFFIVIRSQVLGSFGNPAGVSVVDNFLVGAKDTATFLASAFLVMGKYLLTLLFPVTLCSDYGFNQIPLTGLGDWRVWLSLIAWLGMGVYALIGLRKKDLGAFAILFFMINFSIFSNLLITIGTSYGERLLYAASPGFAFALALLILKGSGEKWKSAPSGLFANTRLWAMAGVILLLYSVRTVTRNTAWKDSFTLYETDLEVSPNSAKLNFHDGLELVKKGNDLPEPQKREWYAKARSRFERAVQILPGYHDAYGQLGLAWYREKNAEKALENYELALKYRPEFPLVHSNMGIIYFERGDLAKARELYEIAVKEDPRMVDALRNLGVVHALQKNFPEAIKWFSQALSYAPDDPTINRYLGSAYRDAGDPDKGRPYLEKADRLEGK